MRYATLLLGFALIPFFAFFTRPYANTGVYGAVQSAAGLPLREVKVNAFANGKWIKTTQTDPSGAYRLDLPAGKYDLEFALPDYETLTVLEVPVPESSENQLNVTLDSALLPKQRLTMVWQPGGRGGRERAALDEGALMHALSDMTVAPAEARKELETIGEVSPVMATKPAGAVREKTSAPAPTALGKSARPTSAVRADRAEKAPSAPKKTTPPPPAPAAADDAEFNPYRGNKFEVALEEKPAPRPSPQPAAPKAGLLTAGEWNDLDNWAKHWTDLLADGEIEAYQTMYGCFPRSRFTVLLQNKAGFPAIDVPLQLKDEQGTLIWEARTDNTGKAELWRHFFEKKETAPTLLLSATVEGKTIELGPVRAFSEGINRFEVDIDCQAPQLLDVMWVVDATGSMGDEIQYLKTELLDVIGRVKNVQRRLTIRMGSVFYRDTGDDYVVKSSGLSPDIQRTVAYIRDQSAGGGGDYPEAVHTALEEAVFQQQWSEKAVARICFLVLDASPHQTPEVNASLQRSITEAARKGIRIIPVSASGVQKDTEFLMKFFGLATNGTYVFLTDHSGIGGKHIEATTDEYKVELLNHLLVRLITQYANVAACDGAMAVHFETPADSTATPLASVSYFPNPALRQLNVDLPFDADKVTLYDAQGVAAFTLNNTAAGRHSIPVEQLPAGFYTLRIWKDGQVQSGKVMVVRT